MLAFNLKLFGGATLLLSLVAFTRADNVDGTEIVSSNGPGSNLAASFRVLNTIPDECQSVCDGVVDSLTTTCATIQCVCNATSTTNIHTCINCLIAVKPGNQTIINQAQAILNEYAFICNEGGVSVPFQTASGFTGTVPTAPPATAPPGTPPPATQTGISTGTGATVTVSRTGGSGAVSSSVGGGTGTSGGSASTGTAAASNGASSRYKFWFGSLLGGVTMGCVIGF